MKKPRILFLMVPAGEIVDQFLEDLKELLDKEDIVIDGGNSYFIDTIRRQKTYSFGYVGCGISGGEYGARHGPSMMVGCERDIYEKTEDIFKEISSKYNGGSCCGWMGTDGAGHFVKIVHNGIEYCEMQVLQEVYTILRSNKRSIKNIHDVFSVWNLESELEGYLLEISAKVLNKMEDGEYVIEGILDRAEQKGTGKMCIHWGLDKGVDTSAISTAVMARVLSNKKERRESFAAQVGNRVANETFIDMDDLKKAYFLCKAVAYAQGCDLLLDAKEHYKWAYTIEDVCDTWRNGCILRCGFLDKLKEMGRGVAPSNSDRFVELCKTNMKSLQRVCLYVLDNELYAPLMTGSLMWLNGMRMSENNGSMLQAMRDYFGRHGVVMKDGTSKNIAWDD